jgi:hypothetical protein
MALPLPPRRDSAGPKTEIKVGCLVLNRMTWLGMPLSQRIV